MLYSVELRSRSREGSPTPSFILFSPVHSAFLQCNCMKLIVKAIGKTHEPYVKEGVELFCKRLSHYFPVSWQLVPMPRHAGSLPPMALKEEESKLLLQGIQPDDYVVLLDERGKMLNSEGFAQLVQQRANAATRSLVFLIGGAYGVSVAVQQRANFSWSLSPLVFPHQLVRLILAEQVYRACTILQNEKYHHP